MSIQLKITAETDIGTREENQDRIVINNFIIHNKYYYEEKVVSDQEIFLIFDGMGGVNITARRSRQSGVARATCPD